MDLAANYLDIQILQTTFRSVCPFVTGFHNVTAITASARNNPVSIRKF